VCIPFLHKYIYVANNDGYIMTMIMTMIIKTKDGGKDGEKQQSYSSDNYSDYCCQSSTSVCGLSMNRQKASMSMVPIPACARCIWSTIELKCRHTALCV